LVYIKADLQYIFSNVNEWLKFSEAKNIALLTVNGASFFVVLQTLNSDLKLSSTIVYCLWLLSFILIISMFFHFLALIPKVKSPRSKRGMNGSEEDNLYFYGHISKYTAPNYLAALKKKYSNEIVTTFHPEELDLANQIIVNSKITYWKYIRCKYGLYLTLLGFSFLSVSILGQLITDFIGRWI
jgi:FlaA1/EpsC-like NDP-sugar epimerase